MRHVCKFCGVAFTGQLDREWRNHVALYHSLSPKPSLVEEELDTMPPMVVYSGPTLMRDFSAMVWV